MNKVTAETAAKMMELVDRTTYQGRVIYLAIAFLQQTGLGLEEVTRLRVRDVYQLGVVRISMQAGSGTKERTVPLSDGARQTVSELLKAQVRQGLQPYPWCYLFRAPSGRPITAYQLASLFWLYREAAELRDAG